MDMEMLRTVRCAIKVERNPVVAIILAKAGKERERKQFCVIQSLVQLSMIAILNHPVGSLE